MGRDPRIIPANSLQHVVDVVAHHRYLLCPSETLNERFLGVLGRAQAKHGMTVCAVVALSSHYHLLVRPRDGRHLAEFMCFLKTNLAKEIGGRLRGLEGPFFGRRYHSTTVSEEEAAQVGVLRYVLGHGVKEGLVDEVRQWPGVHSAADLIDGTSPRGVWIDRTAAWASPPPTEDPSQRLPSSQEVELSLSPLPCWEHLPDVDWRQAVADLVDDIDRQGAAERLLTGKSSLGVEAVLAQDPFGRPENVERSPQPRFHAVARQVLESMVEIWRQVLRAYYSASEALRAGDRMAVFPEGTFPPALPFVPFADSGPTGARGQPA